MKSFESIYLGLPEKREPVKTSGYGEAPINIALIKYWGKRDKQLNLPVTDSLSVTVPDTLTQTTIIPSIASTDRVFLNQTQQSPDSNFAKRISHFLDLFRTHPQQTFEIHTQNRVATAAGLASSASGYAAFVLALNDLFGWQLTDDKLSILARIGSGSACRSLWPGFVYWQAGNRADGLDSYAFALDDTWPDLMLGLVMVTHSAKTISSREAMQITTGTSPLYQAWPATVTAHMHTLRNAMLMHDFKAFGEVIEHNALTMHATMLASWPSIDYRIPETWRAIEKVHQLRREGVPVYFTQDAGPHIKLLFEAKDKAAILAVFPDISPVLLFP